MLNLLLVIVRDLDVVCVTIDEPEANTPLIVDADRVLSLPVLSELMESIAGRNPEVIYSRRQVYVLKLSPRPSRDVWRESFRPAGRVQFGRVPVCERLDHTSSVTRHVTIVKIWTNAFTWLWET